MNLPHVKPSKRTIQQLVLPHLLFSAVFLVSAYISLFLKPNASFATPLWLPAGIAVAGLFVLRERILVTLFLLGILNGLISADFLYGKSPDLNGLIISAEISFFKCLQAYVCFVLITKTLKSTNPSEEQNFQVENTWRHALIYVFSSAIAGIGGSLVLWNNGLLATEHLLESIINWWIGDGLGVLLMIPFSFASLEMLKRKKIDFKLLSIFVPSTIFILFAWYSFRESNEAIQFQITQDPTPLNYLFTVCFITFINYARYNSYTKDIQSGKLLMAQKTELDSLYKTAIHNERVRTIGEITASVMHELGNPLTIIQGRVDLLRELVSITPIDVKKIQQSAESIENASLRLIRTAKSLLDFSKKGDEEVSKMESVQNLIDSTLELTKYRLIGTGIKLEVAEFSDYKIPMNCEKISHVILNLIFNSIDALEELDEKWIKIRIESTECSVLITVTDSGNGIDESVRSDMMSPFYTTKTKDKGTGLGLFLSHKIISEHGGILSYNDKAENTQFLISLPKVSETGI